MVRQVIDSFRGSYRFLSNFYPSTITYENVVYPTVEHAYQAAKALDAETKESIRVAPTAAIAKKLGQSCKLIGDWEDLKIVIMRELLFLKFALPPLRALLLETGDADLIEGNTWGDTFWGVCRGRGQNWLGKLLMEVRAEISK